MDEMGRRDFFEAMSLPGASDEMNFVLRKEHDDGGTFSAEGVEAVGFQMHDYLLARTLGHWRETGAPPQGVTVNVTLTWDGPTDEQLQDRDPPWFSLDDGPGVGPALTSPDGDHRLSTFLTQRRNDE